jgi:hypothetical protein
MENGETTAQGAERETLEEANARIGILGPYALYNIPHINQVYLLFRARLADLAFSPGAETLEVRLFAEDEIPWNEIAFATVRRTLTRYFADRKSGAFPFHIGTIEPMRAPTTPSPPHPDPLPRSEDRGQRTEDREQTSEIILKSIAGPS